LGTFRGPFRHRVVRVAAKVAWLAIGWYAVIRTTPALGASFYIEPTSDALAAERHGHHVVALACLVFVVLAGVAWYAFDAPLLSPILLAGLAVSLLVLSTADWAYLAIPLPYAVMGVASVGIVSRQGPPAAHREPEAR
jgi:hypothetical protein